VTTFPLSFRKEKPRVSQKGKNYEKKSFSSEKINLIDSAANFLETKDRRLHGVSLAIEFSQDKDFFVIV
jgi:hypothetical protein